ncbi:acyl-CoA thioesterase [Yinghuangia seranimata]|uniref:acyl-CoA thioesterase n=1 Tax=Yinghuangia seranimata TaxID=408067 RepID=UPI00248BD2B6|nr:acyl-CoA thioesterase [Yinghuangia seranimata]MDI2129859.1 acyl-CoA thioesterase [Yinghuangia seranimata]
MSATPPRRSPDPARLRLDSYPFVREVPARFADMDLQRHINNVAIATFYEDGRANLNMAMFGSDLFTRVREFRLVVLETTTRYLSEAPFPATYQVGVGITRFGASSFDYGMGLFHDGTCVGVCDTVMVHMTESGPTPIPAQRRALMDRYAFPAVAAPLA